MKNTHFSYTTRVLVLALGWALSASCGAADAASTPRPPAPSLKSPSAAPAQVDSAGFLRRWLVLEPSSVSSRLTLDEVEKSLQEKPYPAAVAALPKDGDVATMAGQELRWHAVDSLGYNVNLYHFAWALSRPTSNVLFWVVTVVDVPTEMKNVRLAIGSNAASAWWLNEERVISLYNDRQSVIDDGVSMRVNLRKGRNVIRAAIINAGGATDFCARFLDAQDQPILGLKTSLATTAAR